MALGVPVAQGFLLGRPEPLPVEPVSFEAAPRIAPSVATKVADPPPHGLPDMTSWRQSIGLPVPASAGRQ
jgi:hypothetical protein